MEGRMEGRTEGRKDGRLEIPPCVPQDIGPLGPLPKKHKKAQIVAKALDGQRYPMPLSVCGDEMVREAAAPKGPMTYAWAHWKSWRMLWSERALGF